MIRKVIAALMMIDYHFHRAGGSQHLAHALWERTPHGEPGLNYLCKGYKIYFAHVAPYMEFMAQELRGGRPAATVMEWVRSRDRLKAEEVTHRNPGRNDPCPCGSGRKYKRCCGA